MDCLKEILLMFSFVNGLLGQTTLGHILIIGGKESTGDQLVSGTVESFYPEYPSANRIEATLSPVRHIHSMGVIGDMVVITGGHAGGSIAGYHQSTTLYYPSNKTFASGPNLSVKRAKLAGAVLDGVFIVCGGRTHGPGFYNSCEAFVGGVWEPRASMLTTRGRHSMVVLNGKMYAIGGDSAYYTPTSSVESYDPATDSWSAVASLPMPLDYLGAAVAQGNIYVSGGMTHYNATCVDGDMSCNGRSANCYKYSDLTDTWSQINPMNRVRYEHVMVEMGGLVFALGGHTSCCNNAEVFDPATGNWTLLPTTLFEERQTSAAVVVYRALAELSCPHQTSLQCNGTQCSCHSSQPLNLGLEDGIPYSDFISIGRDVRGLVGFKVQSEPRITSCASVCDKIKECSFFSYKESSKECYMHDSIAPAIGDDGFKMFAKVFA